MLCFAFMRRTRCTELLPYNSNAQLSVSFSKLNINMYDKSEMH